MIHGLSKVGHIEDIVISDSYRKQGLGKQMIDHLVHIAKLSGCYKVILNCAMHNVDFYKKCGFSGVVFARHHLQEEWEELYETGKLSEEAKKNPHKLFRAINDPNNAKGSYRFKMKAFFDNEKKQEQLLKQKNCAPI